LRRSSTIAGTDHVEAEQAFFQELNRLDSSAAPLSLGFSGRPKSYLYATPLALLAPTSPALKAWVRTDPTVLARAAAGLWRKLTGVGLALGIYHPLTLGFTVRAGSEAALNAVVIAAPLATRLGRPYRRSAETYSLFPPFEKTGLRLLPRQVRGDLALPETEAAAVVLYIVDLLAIRPLKLDLRLGWRETVAAMIASESSFRHPDLVVKLLSAVERADGSVIALLDALATADAASDSTG
jgi:hypothetical protein